MNVLGRMETLFLSRMFWVGWTNESFMLQSLYIISSSSMIITFITLFPTTILYSSLWTYESFMLQPLDIILSYSRTTKFVTLFPTAILCSRLWLFTYYFYMSSLSGGFRNFIHCDHYENLNYTKFNLKKKKNFIYWPKHTHTHTHTHKYIKCYNFLI